MTDPTDPQDPHEARWGGHPPVVDDDDTIADLLEGVCVPALLMSMVHMSGDMGWVRGDVRPRTMGAMDLQGGVPPEQQAWVRARALEVIRAYRDRDGTLPPAPSLDEVHEMVERLVGSEVDRDQADMLIEDLGRRPHDPGGPRLVSAPEAREQLPVCVIGCGEAGLLAGIRLSRDGIPFTILEKNADVGGTWFENHYPGARVDIANHYYSYSFEPHRWSHHFAQQPEIKRYLQDVMARHDVEPYVRWSCTVTQCTWDDEAGEWVVDYHDPDGEPRTLRARALICAVGQLNRPVIADIPGRDRFPGPAFHTARWEHDVDLTGKDVAMIGAGASGFQVGPAIADTVNSLTVYQRTAQWIAPNPIYHQELSDGANWAIEHLPFYDRWYRFYLAFPTTDGAFVSTRVDPEWDDQGNRSVSEANEFTRQVFEAWIHQHVQDPELLEKVMPDYPAMGKRTLQDDGTWFRTLQRDDVELVRTPIDTITETGVRTTDGVERRADVIVYATGFEVNRMIWPLRIVGRDGIALDERWGDSPGAYLGITVPDFPNFFVMYGPSTNPVSGGSLFFQSECQMRYVLGCLDALADRGARTMEVKADVYDDWEERCQTEIARTVWAHRSIAHSYYKNSQGRIHTVQPWRTVDYWRWTLRPDPEDYRFD